MGINAAGSVACVASSINSQRNATELKSSWPDAVLSEHVNVMSQCLNRCNENKTKKQTLSRTTWTSACCYHNSSSSKLFLQLWPRNVTSKRFDFDGSMNFLWFWAFASWKLANWRGQIRSNDQFISIHFHGLSIADASLAQSTARPPNVWLPHATLLCKGLDLKIRVMANYKCSNALSLSRIFKDCSCFKQGCVARLQLGCFIIATHSRSWGGSSHWK